jgi:hypothetical protein
MRWLMSRLLNGVVVGLMWDFGSDKLGQKDEIFDQSQRQTKPSTTNMAHR